jgi:hypothetical protein
LEAVSLTKNEKFLIEWEKHRQKGKRKYMLTNGIISGTVLLIGSKIGWELNPNKIYTFSEYYFYPYISFLVGGFLVGILVSIMKWGLNEDKYDEILNNKKL